MNIARLFSYTKRLESELTRERLLHAQTRGQAQQERHKLIDAMQQNAGRGTAFREPVPQAPWQERPAVGPSQHAARAAQKRQDHERTIRRPTDAEIEAAAADAMKSEPPEPIEPKEAHV